MFFILVEVSKIIKMFVVLKLEMWALISEHYVTKWCTPVH